MIDDRNEPVFPGAILPHWSAMASQKGFSIAARVVDRLHLALRCDACGGLTKTRLSVLMNYQPTCAPCLHAKHIATAAAAGLTMLRRDPSNRHYGYYAASCGHELRRQFALIDQASRGDKALRCDTCLQTKHMAKAAAHGWTLLGCDPDKRVNYRHYCHDACGAEQSVTLGNMTTGRFACAQCGEVWSAAPSAIYLMRFQLVDGRPVVKLGFSRNPASRLNHQLQSGRTRTGELLRVVHLPTGAAALHAEQGMHQRIKATIPCTIVPQERYVGQIKVKSEIYTPDALALITTLLDDLAARLAA
ncbi:MAG: GIY-YIG nuclease family protein [Pseudotabrizicola sp.]|uniref:GIY-YIG nuclease family protein n=1 Tax=Pseudotabrizicola sp. TaxID=2939647 RepID=UPI0027309591|nr:GIY-YIG nuclease family protein [Pseudotabrizicola sp.]MDP2079592.1 GIY-YIG nuclease family protein [Pseudotabrizicola sp.]MDZ7576361.1 GIY-YIG nuclease family protein [Pseudotabrizicola sp.]